MGLYNIINPTTMQGGQPEDVGQVLANFQAIQAILNGGIDNTNLANGILASHLAGYPTDGTKVLKGDGTWATPGLTLLWDSVDAGVALPAASITTPALPATYKHLLIEVVGRGDFAGSDVDVGMRINGDTTGNYDTVFVFNNSGTTSAAGQEIAQTSINMFTITGATANANMAGLASLRIVNYAATVFHKMILGNDGRFDDGAGTTFKAAQRVGRWRSNAAVSTVTFFPRQGVNFVAGSRFTVYGEA